MPSGGPQMVQHGNIRPSTKATQRVQGTNKQLSMSPGGAGGVHRQQRPGTQGGNHLNGISGQTILKANGGQVNGMPGQRATSSKQKMHYPEDDGFMRGARIAEKIQEFYHTTGSQVPSNSSSKNQIVFNKTTTAGEFQGLATGGQNPKSRANLMSQGGSRTGQASKLMYQESASG